MTTVTKLFETAGKPRPALLKLLALMDVQHGGTAASIYEATQDAWYQEGKLRCEISDLAHDESTFAEAQPLLRELGMVDAIPAPQIRCDVAAIGGAKVNAVEKRLQFLIEQWEQGLRFERLVLLGSYRQLFEDEIKRFPDLERCPYEHEMMAHIYMSFLEQSRIPWLCQASVIDTPKPHDRNVNRLDTVRDWIRRGGRASSMILVSSQPFVAYETLTVMRLLSNTSVHGCGYEAASAFKLPLFLDNVAKQIDAELQWR